MAANTVAIKKTKKTGANGEEKRSWKAIAKIFTP
jgi:hypothetical protein